MYLSRVFVEFCVNLHIHHVWVTFSNLHCSDCWEIFNLQCLLTNFSRKLSLSTPGRRKLLNLTAEVVVFQKPISQLTRKEEGKEIMKVR